MLTGSSIPASFCMLSLMIAPPYVNVMFASVLTPPLPVTGICVMGIVNFSRIVYVSAPDCPLIWRFTYSWMNSPFSISRLINHNARTEALNHSEIITLLSGANVFHFSYLELIIKVIYRTLKFYFIFTQWDCISSKNYYRQFPLPLYLLNSFLFLFPTRTLLHRPPFASFPRQLQAH